MATTKTYPCPKCKKGKLVRNGFQPTKDGGRRPQWACRGTAGDRSFCYSTTDPTAPYRDSKKRPRRQEDAKPRKPYRRKIDKRRVIFTSAQNATPVHEDFFATLETLAKDVDAEIAVIPLRYKNATSIWTASQRNEEYWAAEVQPYLYEQRKKFNDNLVVVGDVKIQPTRTDPLSSMESFTHGESAIFGHTKLRMKCVATPQNQWPKIMTTTGACTVPNYTDSQTGKKGEFHHVLGAVLVEFESRSKFHLHHINARRDGAFIFKDKAYYPSGRIDPAGPAKAIVFGDAHYRFADPKVVNATFNPGGLVDQLDAEKLVWHDLLDAYFGSPHHIHNPFIDIAKRRSEFHLARNEVQETVDWMRALGEGRDNYIVPSNHDDMFARWIMRENWKELRDPENVEFYLETALHMARSARMSDTGAVYDDPFIYWVKQIIDENDSVFPLDRGDPLIIDDIACNFHGDKGPGGARGTIKNLSKIGVKVISGHGHSPAIENGHTRTGTMTSLVAEYTRGQPSNWFNTHASIDAFGKRHLHNCVGGKFYME